MFFKCYTQWNWAKPLVIDTEEFFISIDNFRHMPTALEPRLSIMNIITPASPYINSAYKVNLITLKTLTKELIRGLEILEDATTTTKEKWERLF